MPLSWTEIRDRATQFQKRWQNTESEQAESQSFWTEFLNIFGVDRKRVASFEKQVSSKRGKQLKHGRIDLFWPGKLLIEMKSAGKDLGRAFDQAIEYFDGLQDRDLPRYVLVSDFKRFRLIDLEKNIEHPEFALNILRDRVKLFGFVAGYEVQEIKAQDPVNIKAAERMGKLHDALKAGGYGGHALELLLVRLLFCLFADDTGIFQPAGSFREWLENETKPDGSDLGRALAEFFDVLNTPEAQRQKAQQEAFAAFPYINGKLFEETLRPSAFDTKARNLLLDACALDWSTISPAIFGALFQSIMDDKARRNLGAHYTSEENILKLIKPLFLDELWAEFGRVKGNRTRLLEFHKKLRTLTFFDPACGCGNFLVITYRELRKLELEILRNTYGANLDMFNVHRFVNVDVDQFYGIELEEFPAQIAQVALWLTDHQMNRLVSDEFGAYYARIPLKATPHIVHGNALRVDWHSVLLAENCSYVLGNPPFVGAKLLGDAQRADAQAVFKGVENGGLLDYVAAWYIKATRYIKGTPSALLSSAPSPASAGEGWGGARSDGSLSSSLSTRCAFVSTNSITQGEQVGVLWGWLLAQGTHIHFAHRTFKWSNEASGKAAVHCVIIGFGLQDVPSKVIYEYENIDGEAHAVSTATISPYLTSGPIVLLPRRKTPICSVPRLEKGNQPTDGGHLILSPDEKQSLLSESPDAEKFVKKLVGGQEFIRGEERYCLWLVNVPPNELRKYPFILRRIEACRKFRANEGVASDTIALASTPALFREQKNPAQYVVVPEVSSESRKYIPMGLLNGDSIPTNKLQIAVGAVLFEFGILTSDMHMAWTREVCGRLKSDYQYSASIVYNNFPWPSAALPSKTPSPQLSPASAGEGAKNKLRAAIESAAQGVLDARSKFPGASLADLYDPLTMPPELTKAHQKLDAAVDAAYVPDGGKKTWKNDAERVAFLFTRYQQLTSLLPAAAAPKKRAAKKTAKGNF